MRRIRSEGPKVWHNPDVEIPRPVAARAGSARSRPPRASSAPGLDALGAQRDALGAQRDALGAQRDALGAQRDALGAQRDAADDRNGSALESDANGRRAGRVILVPARVLGAKEAERERLLDALLAAEGRPRITNAANAFVAAGFEFPTNQDVQLQLLEHRDESVIRSAIECWVNLLEEESPKRRAVLESRLKRIRENAEEPATESAARRLFRLVTGRPDE